LSPVRIGGGNEDQSVIVLGTTETNDLLRLRANPCSGNILLVFDYRYRLRVATENQPPQAAIPC
jgi:hypothetical protein